MTVKTLSFLCSLLLWLLGATVLVGWAFHIPRMVQVIPGLVGMVPNTACLFILSGLLLYIINHSPFRYQILLERVISIVILVIAIISISQDITGYDLGIDRLLFTPWLEDPNPTPGRMAPNTSIGFIFTTIIGLLLPYANKKSVAILIQVLTLGILIIAMLGILVYSLKLEFIFSWYRYTRMAVHTACGFLILSLGWWATWSQSEWYKRFYKGREDKKILLITGIILLCLTLLTGLGGIAILTYLNVSSVYQSLTHSLQAKSKILTSSILQVENDISTLVENPLVHTALDQGQAKEHLAQITQLLTNKGFTAIQLLDKKGHTLINQGHFEAQPEMAVRLKFNNRYILFWKKGFWLRIILPITSEIDKHIHGYFQGEIPLTDFNQAYKDYQGLGSTGETLLCVKTNLLQAQCFPSRFTPTPFVISLSTSSKLRPVNLALENEAGTMSLHDYKNNEVMVSYSPIPNTGLGMVVKINVVEIYQPINDQLKYILPIALILICSGLILLHWQVVPLVRKVIISEHEANESKQKLLDANIKLEHSLKELGERNTELSILKELSATLPSSLNMRKATEIINKFAKQLFPVASGSLYLLQETKHSLEEAVLLHENTNSKKEFKLEECWGLRRGTVHKVIDPKIDLICSHVNLSQEITPYICIPLLAQGEVIGLFYLEFFNQHNKVQAENNNQQSLLAITFSEQVALGISNIQLRETLHSQTLHDPLTGLYNRRYLENALFHELLQMKKNNLPLTVFMLDIDHFKIFNDTYGHEAGDLVLQALAQLLKDQIRAHDFVCRYGGEEFVFIMPNTSLQTALIRASEIHTELRTLKITYKNKELGAITVSIGVATYPEHAEDNNSLIAAADLALYKAKNTGRNKTISYDEIKEDSK